MSPPKAAVTTCEIYDQALKYARHHNLPPGSPRPLPTAQWPPGCIALLERYREWLQSGGASLDVIRRIYLPMAGHILGLNPVPHGQINLDGDPERSLAYIQAKGLSVHWQKNCRNGLEKFKRFLRQQRGLPEPSKTKPFGPARYTQGLPLWLVNELERYQRTQQKNWRTARLDANLRGFWSGHLRTWRFLVEQCGVRELADLKRQHIYTYTEMRLDEKRAATGINGDLRTLRAFLGFLQEQDYQVSQSSCQLHPAC
jgi:hypothetical protein